MPGFERQQLLRELRLATRHVDWPRIHRLRARLDELPLLDELSIALTAREHPGERYSIQAGQWLIRLLVEHQIDELPTIARLVTLLQHIDRPAARMQLAGLLGARAKMDARPVLDVPIPPPPTPHEHFPDYIDRLRQIGMLDAFSAYNRAQKAAWRQ